METSTIPSRLSPLSKLYTPPSRSNRLELLDTHETNQADLAANLADIRVINRLLGDTTSLTHIVHHICKDIIQQQYTTHHMRDIRILDVATGSADIPLAFQRYAHRAGIPIRLFASDILMDVLHEAERHTRGNVPLICHSALAMPYNDNEMDIVTFSKALHHFTPAEARILLREMVRVARHAVIVCDLNRSWPAYWAAHILGLVLRSPISRHDGPLSVLRAYTATEVCELASRANMHVQIWQSNLMRLIFIINAR